MSDFKIKIYLIADKKKLMFQIKKINDKKLYDDIYEIVKNSNIEYTKNSYGIIFDFNKLPNISIHDIVNLVNNYKT